MNRCVSLQTQKSLRDLAQLPRLVNEVRWAGADEIVSAEDIAIVAAAWLAEDGKKAAETLTARRKAGRATIIVPRTKAGNLPRVLGAPSAVSIKLGEYDSLQWSDKEHFNVPGQVIIDTPLHAGRWAQVEGLGTAILAYRAHEGAGPVVLCTAGMASRQFGVAVEEQRRLLDQIDSDIQATVSNGSTTARGPEAFDTPPHTVDEFLSAGDSDAAIFALLVATCDGKRDAERLAVAADRLGFGIPLDEITSSLNRLQESPVEDLVNALRRNGWGAHLRQARAALAERRES